MEADVKMGLREANQRFSRAIKAVKAGEEVVLTERGEPIAVLRPIEKGGRGEAALKRLEAAGYLRRASQKGPMSPWTPRALKGRSMNRTVREERDAR